MIKNLNYSLSLSLSLDENVLSDESFIKKIAIRRREYRWRIGNVKWQELVFLCRIKNKLII